MSRDFFDLDRLKENSLLLKSAVLCCGLKQNAYSKELSNTFNPFSVKRTGNVGVHFRIDGLIVNAGFSSPSIEDELSPIELKKVGKDCWGIYINDAFIKNVSLINTPKWYSKQTSLLVPMGEVFLFEGENNLMGSLGNPCCFFQKGEQCKFCGYFGSKKTLDISDFSEVACEAFNENKNITITLTNGNTRSQDRGCFCYIPVVNQINNSITRNFPGNKVPLQVECAPPEDVRCLYDLFESGVDSFSVNYECFDPEVRSNVIPGKGKIPTFQYENAWRCIIDNLGNGRVSSAILFGLDTYQNTLDGLFWLISLGVRPNVIPFKPMIGALFQFKKRPSYIEYYEICRELSGALKESSLDQIGNLGCSSCGGCNIEGDFCLLGEKV